MPVSQGHSTGCDKRQVTFPPETITSGTLQVIRNITFDKFTWYSKVSVVRADKWQMI